MDSSNSISKPASANPPPTPLAPWYEGITRYQWIVLAIACLGWIFDVFEGQIFVASMNEAMPSLLPPGTDKGTIAYYNNIAFGAFLLGGALGGVVFGMLSDRIGRTKTMVYTILMYSMFTCVTAFAKNWQQMAVLRFLVAMGVGGEWAVASAMVAEVFPKRARAWSLGIFHASSVLGTFLAIAAGVWLVGNPKIGWRWGFGVGAIPSLLTLWIRWRLEEPTQWVAAQQTAKHDETKKTGRISDLFKAGIARRTIIGVILAAVGLATFWGVHVYGKDLMRRNAESRILAEQHVPADATKEARTATLSQFKSPIKSAEMLGMLLVTTGGGLGLLSFGPLCERLGRRGTFLFFHIGGMAATLLLFKGISHPSDALLYVALPIFGYLTLGMHAGYAIYFPELFPTRVRGTGGGFCFNVGRILAAPILFLSGWMQKDWGFTLENAAALLSMLFLVGIVALLFAPETKGQELPE
jgi:MFS family permease